MSKLNPLLKLAAISGVETAIELHIRRGDDLDGRDAAGATPLILAAAKGKKGAVRLLLDAGANPTISDVNGMDALAHAIKGGCHETVSLLTEALANAVAAKPIKMVSAESSDLACEEDRAQFVLEPADLRLIPVAGIPQLARTEVSDGVLEPTFVERASSCTTQAVESDAIAATADEAIKVVSLDGEPLSELVADDWVAEEDASVPEGDESVAEAARKAHDAIGRHRIVDRDEDWGDVDLHLPARAAPIARDEGGGAIRDLLLAAIRNGMVSENDLIDVCLDANGCRNEEAERLLTVVIGELGATVVEWTGLDDALRAEPNLAEEDLLTEATEFAEELTSGFNDPFRFYSKDIRKELLKPEEEIALGREMEEAGRDALSALASWPDGLSALFDAAARVARGEADAESFCAGPEPSSDDGAISLSIGSGKECDEDNDESELNRHAYFFVNAVAAVEGAREDARRAIDALESARLRRGFLVELADRAGRDEAGRAFFVALCRQAAARERMVLCNLRLALSIAKKHLWSGIPFDDLVQEANIGLMKAVERYDWRRGFRFSTYATWWIRQQVSRFIADTGRVVRAPNHVQETARKVIRERKAEEARLGRPETEIETARRADMSVATTTMLLSLFDDVASLDDINFDTLVPRADSLGNAWASDPADVAENASLRTTLLRLLDDLDERSREVISLRFGLEGDDPMTLDEVGQHFGVTRERIRQIESKAMRRLSNRSRKEVLWPFMGDGYAPSSSPANEQERSEVASGAAEKALRDENVSAASVAHEAQLSLSLRSMRDVESNEIRSPVRRVVETLCAPRSMQLIPPSVSLGDQTSRIVHEARVLGLEVQDRRTEGGALRILVPLATAPKVAALVRKLLASGFRVIERDVFVK